MPDGAASPLRGVSPAPGPRAASAQPSSLSSRSARHGSALGCAGRTGARIRGLARGGRRVVPVAGHDASVAGASRRDGPNPHLQANTGRSPVQPHVPCASQLVRPARPPGTQSAPRRRHGGTHASAHQAGREGQHLQQSSRHEGRFTARQRTPLRRLAQRRAAAGLTTLHAGLEARRAFGVKHDGAARGGPQPIPAQLPGPKLGENTGSTRLGVATAPGSRRQGVTRRRPWRDGGATRSATGGSKARPHTETRQGDGARGKDGHSAHSRSAV
jgi:hypothetical protein